MGDQPQKDWEKEYQKAFTKKIPFPILKYELCRMNPTIPNLTYTLTTTGIRKETKFELYVQGGTYYELQPLMEKYKAEKVAYDEKIKKEEEELKIAEEKKAEEPQPSYYYSSPPVPPPKEVFDVTEKALFELTEKRLKEQSEQTQQEREEIKKREEEKTKKAAEEKEAEKNAEGNVSHQIFKLMT